MIGKHREMLVLHAISNFLQNFPQNIALFALVCCVLQVDAFCGIVQKQLVLVASHFEIVRVR